MSVEETPEGVGNEGGEEAKKPFPLKGALITAVGAIAMGGAAAGVAYLIAPGGGACPTPAAVAEKPAKPVAPKDVAFINVEPLVISLGPNARARYLKISVSLETTKTHEKDINVLMPRIRDVLNNYLRAVDEQDLERPAGMTRLRAQMLRRLRLVTPESAVNDILITDFVLT